MKTYYTYAALILAVVFLNAPLAIYAKEPRFEDPARIEKLCEHHYNGQRKTKDCTCFVEKYKHKEMEMFKQRGSGTVASYDNVFRLIDNECHIYNETGNARLDSCHKNSPVQGLTRNQQDTYCKCQAKAFNEMEVMFQHMPDADATQRKQIIEQMEVAARHKCKEQALRNWN